MSDLQRMWAKNKLSNLPPVAFDEREEQEIDGVTSSHPGLEIPEHPDDDSSSASSASSTGTIIPSPSQRLFARPQGADLSLRVSSARCRLLASVPPRRTLEPIQWTTFFERELFLQDEEEGAQQRPGEEAAAAIRHHVYVTSPVGAKGPLFVMHHGAGSSGLSFAVAASEIRKRLPSAGILSLDVRGHGSTAAPEHPLDLSLPTLTADLLRVLRLARAAMGWADSMPFVLVGHSLGGAVVTEVANVLGGKGGGGGAAALLGCVVLDVVEGSAIDALQSMQAYLSTRPAGFPSLVAAIDWHVRSRTIRNSTSARTSVPALVVEAGSRQNVVVGGNGVDETGSGDSKNRSRDDEEGMNHTSNNTADTTDPRPWKWRTDLAATHPFWESWFSGLSKKFLKAPGGRLLMLAGTDRLDTELTIGQMQGKYALQVFPEAGHFIHEDLPEKTAVSLVDFYRRNDRSQLVLPPKVDDMLKQGKRL